MRGMRKIRRLARISRLEETETFGVSGGSISARSRWLTIDICHRWRKSSSKNAIQNQNKRALLTWAKGCFLPSEGVFRNRSKAPEKSVRVTYFGSQARRWSELELLSFWIQFIRVSKSYVRTPLIICIIQHHKNETIIRMLTIKLFFLTKFVHSVRNDKRIKHSLNFNKIRR